LIYVADILELALKDGEHIDRNEYQSFAEWASSTCMQGKYGKINPIESEYDKIFLFIFRGSSIK
jgi:hypothetical protein